VAKEDAYTLRELEAPEFDVGAAGVGDAAAT